MKRATTATAATTAILTTTATATAAAAARTKTTGATPTTKHQSFTIPLGGTDRHIRARGRDTPTA